MAYNELTLVTGSKEALDESLTQEEQDALRDYYDAIEGQGAIESLDADTKDTLKKIWTVRKTKSGPGTVHKAFLNGTVFKRSDYEPWQ